MKNVAIAIVAVVVSVIAWLFRATLKAVGINAFSTAKATGTVAWDKTKEASSSAYDHAKKDYAQAKSTVKDKTHDARVKVATWIMPSA